ncbi:unnamed protein product [Parascedosporium putredinis]|uniref:Uncharacterized protein n=1 Tax=Parascedosporium putredinis TaxID=1442378 RepID=A0A9P1MCM1_9PEZI|nr:unnamed protein product [Parascedosporium putredinis]CAI7996852.1 unnamed protein product [Parascedosporium putredinis]
MTQILQSDDSLFGPRSAVLSYFRFNPDVHTREKPYEILVNLAPGHRRHNQEFEDRSVTIADARSAQDQFSLDAHGFCWRKWAGPEEWRGIDAEGVKELGHDRIMSGYVTEAEAFLKAELEAADGKEIDIVKVFDYRLRVNTDLNSFQARTLDLDDGLDPLLPVPHPHIDQSFRGAVLRVREHMKDDADELLKRRFRIIKY